MTKTLRKTAITLTIVATSAFASTISDAFCGFYVSGSSEQLTNKATRVALMRHGQRTVLTMSNDYDGPAQDFAMVVPVPVVLQQDNVRTLPHDVFSKIESLTAPRLVEYWEQDPCHVIEHAPLAMAMPSTVSSATRADGSGADLGVRIEARFSVGEYQILASERASAGRELEARAGPTAATGRRRSAGPAASSWRSVRLASLRIRAAAGSTPAESPCGRLP